MNEFSRDFIVNFSKIFFRDETRKKHILKKLKLGNREKVGKEI